MNRYSSAYPNLIIQRPNLTIRRDVPSSNETPKTIVKEDLSKTLKHEKQKLEQHKHMNNLFKSRNRQMKSTCTSCQKK